MTETGHTTLPLSTTATTKPPHTLPLRISVVALYSITFIASLVGNTLVLNIIYKRPHIRTTITYLFVNLAVADLMITAFAIPDGVAYYFRNDKWPGGVGGDIVCRMVRFLFALAIAASLGTLTAMTLDRFIGVVYPFSRASRRRSPKKTTAVIWLSSTLFMFTRLLTISNSNDTCEADWSLLDVDTSTGETIILVLYVVILFILPLTLMIALYSIMCTKLRHHERPGIIELDRSRRLARKRKVMKMLVSIVVVFILCWFPVAIMHLTLVFNKKPPDYVMFLLFWCGHSNSAVNPWMYIYLNTQFRGAFLEIIGRRPRNRTGSSNWTTSRKFPKCRTTLLVTGRETVL